MFPPNRRKVREVDVEVVMPGGDGAIGPASSDSEPPNNGGEPHPVEATPGVPVVGSLLALGLRRIRGQAVTEPLASETIADPSPTTEEPVEQPPGEPRPRRGRRLIRVPAGEPMLDTTVETAELIEADAEEKRPEPSSDQPQSAEPQPVEEATDETPAPAPTPRPKTRVVWSSSPAPAAQRARTLKLTKRAPNETMRAAPLKRESVDEPTVETPRRPASRPVAPTAPQNAAPTPIDERVEETPTAPTPPPADQTCDILFWRGYRKAAFYGRTFDETGEAVAVAESPFFRSTGNGTPEPTEAAKAAYEALRSQLIAAGWEPVAAGSDWCDETFRLTAAPEPAPE